MVREKSKQLGEEYTAKQYVTQVIIFSVAGAGIAYLYFIVLFGQYFMALWL